MDERYPPSQGWEEWRGQVDRELLIIRGPVPLEHDKPIEKGALGEHISMWKGARGLVKKGLIGLAVMIVGGVSGTWVAIKSHYIDQGREAERRKALEDLVHRNQCRLDRMEGVYIDPDCGPMIQHRNGDLP